jgi:hypothetical protein
MKVRGECQYSSTTEHSGYYYLLWFWQLIVVVSLSNINQLVFVMEMQWFYCELGSELLDIIWVNF